MYDLNQDYSLGGLLPFALFLFFAFVVAKFLSFLKLANKDNASKWTKFFGLLCGFFYGLHMESSANTNSESLPVAASLIFFVVGSLIGWVFFWLAFAFALKDKEKD
jgi:F0F1-type ATP synthase membrane subunit a